MCLAQVATYATKTQDLHMLYSQTVWLAHLRYTFQTCVLLVEQRQTGRLLQGRNEKEVGRRLLRPSSQPQSEHFRDEFILELSKKLVNTCFFFNVFLKLFLFRQKEKAVNFEVPSRKVCTSPLTRFVPSRLRGHLGRDSEQPPTAQLTSLSMSICQFLPSSTCNNFYM